MVAVGGCLFMGVCSKLRWVLVLCCTSDKVDAMDASWKIFKRLHGGVLLCSCFVFSAARGRDGWRSVSGHVLLLVSMLM